MATTTQLYHVTEGKWNEPLMEELGLSASLFIEPVQPGTVIGRRRMP